MTPLDLDDSLEAAELTHVDGELLLGDRVVIVGRTTPLQCLRPWHVTWKPWIGQPCPTQF